ncbi:alpha/beta fold hydrolase [Solimonas flava]|uniref:alpha/beta fold hydrolase n=1 Tax=Solimonas flava TaxID=415849 RepID=UPI000418A62A|nr:alpha/beta hydrolase [Solimonas flava]
MPTLRLNDYDLAYVETGSGTPLLMIHGSLCDYRYWSPQMQAFGARRCAIAVSLRHCWPEAWDGSGDGYSAEQHVDDLIAFIDALDAGPVDLLGHSRGGYIALRVAQRAPQRVGRLILAEPGGLPDTSLVDTADAIRAHTETRTRAAAALIAAGDVDGGLAVFINGVSGTPIWERMASGFRRMATDNARTLLGQVREAPLQLTRAGLAAISQPTLLIGGALTPPPFPKLLDLLQTHIAGAQRVTIAGATHAMNLAAPRPFNAAVLDFLA